jgi:hypothetical protein
MFSSLFSGAPRVVPSPGPLAVLSAGQAAQSYRNKVGHSSRHLKGLILNMIMYFIVFKSQASK